MSCIGGCLSQMAPKKKGTTSNSSTSTMKGEKGKKKAQANKEEEAGAVSDTESVASNTSLASTGKWKEYIYRIFGELNMDSR